MINNKYLVILIIVILIVVLYVFYAEIAALKKISIPTYRATSLLESRMSLLEKKLITSSNSTRDNRKHSGDESTIFSLTYDTEETKGSCDKLKCQNIANSELDAIKKQMSGLKQVSKKLSPKKEVVKQVSETKVSPKHSEKHYESEGTINVNLKAVIGSPKNESLNELEQLLMTIDPTINPDDLLSNDSQTKQTLHKLPANHDDELSDIVF